MKINKRIVILDLIIVLIISFIFISYVYIHESIHKEICLNHGGNATTTYKVFGSSYTICNHPDDMTDEMYRQETYLQSLAEIVGYTYVHIIIFFTFFLAQGLYMLEELRDRNEIERLKLAIKLKGDN